MPGLHLGCAHYLLSVPAGLHEAEINVKLRVSQSSFRPALPTARWRPLHAADDTLHIRGCIRASVSFKSR